jgi:hypothetical protein
MRRRCCDLSRRRRGWFCNLGNRSDSRWRRCRFHKGWRWRRSRRRSRIDSRRRSRRRSHQNNLWLCWSCRGFGWTRRRRSHGWLHNHRDRGGRRGDRRPSGNRRRSGRSFGYNRICGRTRRNSRLCCRRHNARFLAHRRHDLARLRASCRCCGRRRGHHRGRRGLCRNRLLGRSGGAGGELAPARRVFLLLLLSQNCLKRVTGLGDVGQVDLRLQTLRRARLRACAAGCATVALKLPAHLLGLVVFNRAGVSFALTQAEVSQDIKNLLALDFHLAREIVDSNLAHPPLFETCYPKP